MIETFRRRAERSHGRVSDEIEAAQVLPSTIEDVASWCGGKILYSSSGLHELEVFNYEGPVIASPGDWVVKDSRGKFYAIFEELFFSLYERKVSA